MVWENRESENGLGGRYHAAKFEAFESAGGTMKPRGLHLVPALAALIGAGSAAAGPLPTFSGPISVGRPGTATVLVATDLNEDGRTDLVAFAADRSQLVPLISNGDGSFQRGRPVSVDSGVAWLAVGSFNGDAHADIVAVGGRTTVLLGDGHGGLRLATRLPIQGQVVATGDLSGDGKHDLVVTDRGLQDVTVALGNGDGSFSAQLSVNVGLAPAAVVVTDMNSDNRPDLVTASALGQVSIRLSHADGTFDAPVLLAPPALNVPSYQPLSGEAALVVDDLDRDGRLDIALTRSGGDVVVFAGIAGGQFAPAERYRAGIQPDSLASADINADGVSDLVTVNSQSGRVSVLLGTGAAAFSTTPISFAAGSAPSGLVVSDLNNDARPDIATGTADGFVTTLLNGSTRPVLFGLKAAKKFKVPVTPCSVPSKIPCKGQTLIRFGLSSPGNVTLTFRRGKRFLGSVKSSGLAGDNEVVFAGFLGKQRLAPGKYEIFARVRNGRGTSRAQRVSMTIS